MPFLKRKGARSTRELLVRLEDGQDEDEEGCRPGQKKPEHPRSREPRAEYPLSSFGRRLSTKGQRQSPKYLKKNEPLPLTLHPPQNVPTPYTLLKIGLFRLWSFPGLIGFFLGYLVLFKFESDRVILKNVFQASGQAFRCLKPLSSKHQTLQALNRRSTETSIMKRGKGFPLALIGGVFSWR